MFGLPGVGRYFVQGAINRDYTLVMGMVVVYAALILLLNLVVDLATAGSIPASAMTDGGLAGPAPAPARVAGATPRGDSPQPAVDGRC